MSAEDIKLNRTEVREVQTVCELLKDNAQKIEDFAQEVFRELDLIQCLLRPNNNDKK